MKIYLYEFSGDEKTVYCSDVIDIRFHKKTKFLDSYVFIDGNNFSNDLGVVNNFSMYIEQSGVKYIYSYINLWKTQKSFIVKWLMAYYTPLSDTEILRLLFIILTKWFWKSYDFQSCWQKTLKVLHLQR